MPDAFRITTQVSALPERIYMAWLDSAGHSAFTGAQAKVDPAIGGKFSAWDGYIQGRTVELLIGRRIVQTWRTKEFPPGSPDSRVEVQLEFADGGTRLTLMHSNLPDGQGERYKKGWFDNYFTPMRDYFARLLAGDAPLPRPSPSDPPVKRGAKSASKSSKKGAPKPRAAARRPPPSKARAKAGKRPSRPGKKAK